MEEINEKLGAILGNPDLMKQIVTMAQALNQQNPPEGTSSKDAQQKPKTPQSKPAPPPQRSAPPVGKNEIEWIQRISAFSKQTSLDQQQQALLKALNPYLSHDRIGKLEKAMHAAKLARFASTSLEQSGGQPKFGR